MSVSVVLGHNDISLKNAYLVSTGFIKATVKGVENAHVRVFKWTDGGHADETTLNKTKLKEHLNLLLLFQQAKRIPLWTPFLGFALFDKSKGPLWKDAVLKRNENDSICITVVSNDECDDDENRTISISSDDDFKEVAFKMLFGLYVAYAQYGTLLNLDGAVLTRAQLLFCTGKLPEPSSIYQVGDKNIFTVPNTVTIRYIVYGFLSTMSKMTNIKIDKKKQTILHAKDLLSIGRTLNQFVDQKIDNLSRESRWLLSDLMASDDEVRLSFGVPGLKYGANGALYHPAFAAYRVSAQPASLPLFVLESGNVKTANQMTENTLKAIVNRATKLEVRKTIKTAETQSNPPPPPPTPGKEQQPPPPPTPGKEPPATNQEKEQQPSPPPAATQESEQFQQRNFDSDDSDSEEDDEETSSVSAVAHPIPLLVKISKLKRDPDWMTVKQITTTLAKITSDTRLGATELATFARLIMETVDDPLSLIEEKIDDPEFETYTGVFMKPYSQIVSLLLTYLKEAVGRFDETEGKVTDFTNLLAVYHLQLKPLLKTAEDTIQAVMQNQPPEEVDDDEETEDDELTTIVNLKTGIASALESTSDTRLDVLLKNALQHSENTPQLPLLQFTLFQLLEHYNAFSEATKAAVIDTYIHAFSIISVFCKDKDEMPNDLSERLYDTIFDRNYYKFQTYDCLGPLEYVQKQNMTLKQFEDDHWKNCSVVLERLRLTKNPGAENTDAENKRMDAKIAAAIDAWDDVGKRLGVLQPRRMVVRALAFFGVINELRPTFIRLDIVGLTTDELMAEFLQHWIEWMVDIINYISARARSTETTTDIAVVPKNLSETLRKIHVNAERSEFLSSIAKKMAIFEDQLWQDINQGYTSVWLNFLQAKYAELYKGVFNRNLYDEKDFDILIAYARKVKLWDDSFESDSSGLQFVRTFAMQSSANTPSVVANKAMYILPVITGNSQNAPPLANREAVILLFLRVRFLIDKALAFLGEDENAPVLRTTFLNTFNDAVLQEKARQIVAEEENTTIHSRARPSTVAAPVDLRAALEHLKQLQSLADEQLVRKLIMNTKSNTVDADGKPTWKGLWSTDGAATLVNRYISSLEDASPLKMSAIEVAAQIGGYGKRFTSLGTAHFSLRTYGINDGLIAFPLAVSTEDNTHHQTRLQALTMRKFLGAWVAFVEFMIEQAKNGIMSAPAHVLSDSVRNSGITIDEHGRFQLRPSSNSGIIDELIAFVDLDISTNK